jgi:hypothetical protein
LRQEIIELLYGDRDIIVSTTTSKSDGLTDLIDNILAPASDDEVFRGAWIYVGDQPTKADVGKNVNNSGVIAIGDTSFDMEASHGIVVNDAIQIVDEIMLVTNVSTNTLTVTRAIQGTTAIEHADGLDVYIIGPAVGELTKCINVDFTGTTSALTIAPGLSCRLVSGQEYEVHYDFSPKRLLEALNRQLGTMTHIVDIPNTLVTDGDIRASGVTDWTASSATLTKDTTKSLRGAQSLKIEATGANGQAQSASMDVKGDTPVLVSVDVFITAGDGVKILLIDVTNANAEIDTAESEATGWVTLYFMAKTPITCEQVALWLEAPDSGDIVYVDNVIVWPMDKFDIDLPGTIEYATEVEQIGYFPRGRGLSESTDDNAYKISGKPFEFFARYDTDLTDANLVPHQLRLQVKSVTKPLWLRARIDYDALSADTGNTVAHRDIVVYLTLAEILDRMALTAERDEKPDLATRLSVRAEEARREIEGELRLRMPEVKGEVHGTFRN